ncbi:MAG: ATP phosphoribosyltransferase regulatory subunit [Deltaproteobacteria bacterium]|nr:ATP phosphoribosyltransferase regulatory subunit [Deltaproteobacteria bacterium]
MSTPPIRLPAGVRDFLPRAAARRRSLAARVLDVFERWGYARIITPMFECADVLERGLGHDARAAAIRFVEPGSGEVVALRPDITPQVARVVATRLADVEGPIRLCYEGAVTRLAGERGQREILQAGIELIDAGDPGGDAEVLAVAAASLAASGLPETRLDVGHVAPARCVLAAAPDDNARDRITAALARKDRAGLRIAAAVLPDAIRPLAEALVGLWGPAETTLARAVALPWPAEVRAALDSLRAVLAGFADLADRPVPDLTIDLGDLRGFDYYTGVRFAGYAGGAPDAVLRGGRYDELIARYGRAARATGFAIDLEALAQAQRTAGLALPVTTAGVAVHGAGAAAFARELRAQGIRAVVAASAPTASWLRGAGFDSAALLDARELVRADETRRTLDTADVRALVKLLEENPCPS